MPVFLRLFSRYFLLFSKKIPVYFYLIVVSIILKGDGMSGDGGMIKEGGDL